MEWRQTGYPPVIANESLTVISTERSEWRDLHPRHAPKNTSPTPHRMHATPSDSFLNDFLPDGAENGGKTPENGTVHHVFRHFDVGRCRKQWQNAQKRDRPSYFSPFSCRTVPNSTATKKDSRSSREGRRNPRHRHHGNGERPSGELSTPTYHPRQRAHTTPGAQNTVRQLFHGP